MKYFVSILVILFLISCSSKPDIPNELKMSFDYIEENWTAENIESFTRTDERSATIDQHFGMGMFLRNNWIRNNKESITIQQFFSEKGISHPDDISAIILKSYHRYLNDKELKLQEQIDYYKRYWSEIDKCDQNQEELAKKYIENFDLGDSLTVKLPMGINENDATNYACFEDWEEFDTTSILIKGVLVEKSTDTNLDEAEFKIDILSKSALDVSIHGQPIYLCDTLRVHLKSSWRLYPFNY
ncbi:MAG: DUF6794 domain-containing protein [Putridiphycobacter sp.]